jgi:antitoxin component of MazEF toxin-antitoxin module
MQKRLSRYGNSFALIIDKPILELLNITEDTILQVSTDGTTIIISPQLPTSSPYKVSDDKKVQKSFEDAMEKYTPVLKKLAKN